MWNCVDAAAESGCAGHRRTRRIGQRWPASGFDRLNGVLGFLQTHSRLFAIGLDGLDLFVEQQQFSDLIEIDVRHAVHCDFDSRANGRRFPALDRFDSILRFFQAQAGLLAHQLIASIFCHHATVERDRHRRQARPTHSPAARSMRSPP